MASTLIFPFHYFILLLMVVGAVIAAKKIDPTCPGELEKLDEAFETCQKNAMLAVRQIFNEEQNCLPRQRKCDTKMKKKLAETEARMARNTKALIAVALTPAGQKKDARVPRLKISAKLNTSLIFFCESSAGEPLSSCLWGREVNGQSEATLIDEVDVQADGVLYLGHNQHQGKCSVRIDSTTEAHLGTWSCVLMAQNGDVFTGEIKVKELEPTIYFASSGGVLRSYSMDTSEASAAMSSTERLWGVAYDFQRDLVYWSTNTKIYRKQTKGGQATAVLDTSQYGPVVVMDFDWITANIYACTSGGHILACDTRKASSMNCAAIVTGQRYARGIALNPNQGKMFWTTYSSPSGSISRAGMDGSNPSIIVTGLNHPAGITIDVQDSRIYWTIVGGDQIRSSNLEGYDVRTVIQFPKSSGTYGIGYYRGRLFCTNFKSKTLHSLNTTGEPEARVLHADTGNLFHLAIISSRPDLPTNRRNHCENQRCSKVCVLTGTSFKCVS